MLRKILTFVLLLNAITSLANARSAAEISATCEQAGQIAAQQTGVPLNVLHAITLTETGKKIDGKHRPWPWTVNMEGVGKWFATREEALEYVMEHYNRGARSFDVGCFQINYRWHGNAFASISDMFDPRLNALYAGQFLRSLYGETKSWSKSAGAYHSRTPKYATKYSARFDRILARLQGKAPLPPAASGTEYVHSMTPSAPLDAQAQDPAFASYTPPRAEVPATPWVPPPPSKFGSVAAVEHLPAGPPLLTQARRGLY